MLRYLKALLRGLTYPARVAVRRPLAAGLVTCGTLALVAAGVYVHATRQLAAAKAALAADHPIEARERLSVCLVVWPASPDVRLLAARATRLTGDTAAAEEHLNQCLRLNGGATEGVQLEFLLLRVQTGELDELAPALLDIVQKDHAESPIILETLARAYIHRLRYKAAYACLSNWIELRPGAVKAYQWRGFVLERLGNHKGATADYHKALELLPDLLPVRLRVAEMLIEDNRVPEALPHLERLHEQAPDHPVVLARLGICRFFQGRSGEARRLLEAAAPHLPTDPSLFIHLARLDLQDGRGDDAEQRLNVVLANDPSDTEARYLLVSALQVQGRTDDSAAVLKEYERYRGLVDRTNKLLKDEVDAPGAGPAVATELGQLLLEIRREEVGLYWLYKALERAPGYQPAHKALAEHYERKGDPDKAATHRRQVRGSVPAAAPGVGPKH